MNNERRALLDCLAEWQSERESNACGMAHLADRAIALIKRDLACKYGDPLCPCQDGDICHYEGTNPMSPPAITSP